MIAAVGWPALALGAGAAFSVGPVFVTIMQIAITRGYAASVRVILGSALADALLLIPALAFSWIIAPIARATAWIALAGAAFLAYLAIAAAAQARRLWRGQAAVRPLSGWALRKGLLANLTSPTTWTFWLAVGTPALLRARHLGGGAGVWLFLAVWFATASGLEAALALAVSRSRHLISGRGLAAIEAASAAFFLVLAAALLQRAAAGLAQNAGASVYPPHSCRSAPQISPRVASA